MKFDTKIKIYYDPRIHAFRTIRGVSHNGYIVSGGTEFYTDAKTTILEEILDEEKFSSLIRIDDIENFHQAEKINLGIKNIPIWEYKVTKIQRPRKISISQLENLLKTAVEKEDYEEASRLRDRIKSNA